MADTANVGTGSTIAFGTSVWAPKISKIMPPKMSREAHGYALLNPATLSAGQYGNELKILSDIVKAGECQIEGFFDER
jgi:hypothetical protein